MDEVAQSQDMKRLCAVSDIVDGKAMDFDIAGQRIAAFALHHLAFARGEVGEAGSRPGPTVAAFCETYTEGVAATCWMISWSERSGRNPVRRASFSSAGRRFLMSSNPGA